MEEMPWALSTLLSMLSSAEEVKRQGVPAAWSGCLTLHQAAWIHSIPRRASPLHCQGCLPHAQPLSPQHLSHPVPVHFSSCCMTASYLQSRLVMLIGGTEHRQEWYSQYTSEPTRAATGQYCLISSVRNVRAPSLPPKEDLWLLLSSMLQACCEQMCASSVCLNVSD